MADPQSTADRQFAVEVVQTLRGAGHEAVWAGGCVRDQLLGRAPKDYDVATSAEPDAIRELFGRRRTLPIGAAFGVITVLGGRRRGQIEVATFRRDAQYSDGRRPDSVAFSTAEEDAQRRDFTINGLFYDPIDDRVIDYVGGVDDLARKRIRAIGSADERIAEDKLRMLRAVRFAASLAFEIESDTMAAVQRNAGDILVVSPERIGAEMRRVLSDRPATGFELLELSGLLPLVAPGLTQEGGAEVAALRTSLRHCEQDNSAADFPVTLGVALWHAADPPAALAELTGRWRLSNAEVKLASKILASLPVLLDAPQRPWPELQRVLAADDGECLAAAAAVAAGRGEGPAALEHCRQRIAGPRQQWDPSPLIDGHDLLDAGLRPGRHIKELLERVRDAQLEGRVATKDDALRMARRLGE